jgi:exodeoxyribonuclease VII large subunit
MDDPVRAVARPVWSVSALLQAASDALAARFGACVVRGEIVGFSRAPSGHCYFTLKDAEHGEGALRCALFRRAASLLDFAPADGQLVDVRGRLDVYGARGELQLVVEGLRRSGAGALYERFLQLRARLQAEGLFDAALKRPLPSHPRTVGVVTSPAAAALRDVATALARRSPHVGVVVYPSPVQGAEAPAELAAALARANRRAEVDVLILCRGGGSLEDLWAFNDERLVRAIRASRIPLVCGVGHETDLTLADLAADVRAPTPTAAAELAAPERGACLDALSTRARNLRRRVAERLERHAQRLDRASLRLARPSEGLRVQRERLGLLAHRLAGGARRWLEARGLRLARAAERTRRAALVARQREQAHLGATAARLDALDPRRVLARGYALLTDRSGHAIVSARRVAVGARVFAVLADGRLDLAVRGNPDADDAAHPFLQSSLFSQQTSREDRMENTLPPLPYAMDALAPHLSRETLEYHYGKHHKAYVDNLNNLQKGTEFEKMALEDIVRKSSGGVYNNAAQVTNHTFFWSCMRPGGGGEPGGGLADAIKKKWGGYAAFKEAFQKSAVGNFGSGWTWLVKKSDGSVDIVNMGAAGTPLTTGDQRLLTIDVWEHAYYIDYRNQRPKFVETFMNSLVNWEFAERNFAG